VLYGTAPCPKILGYSGDAPEVHNVTAQVYTTDTPGEFKSVCPDGHEMIFDSRWATPNVTPNP
jgi:hypothetical protein